MTSSLPSIQNSPLLSLPPNNAETPAPAFKSMSPEQIISFVQDTYANIDGQLSDYQDEALAKNALANQLRDYKKLVREYQNKKPEDFPTTQPAIDVEIARINAEFKGLKTSSDPELRKMATDLEAKVLPTMQEHPVEAQYSSNQAYWSGNSRSPLSAPPPPPPPPSVSVLEPPKNLSKEEAETLLKNADDSLQTLNQDNELTMMRLSTLMQQRQHVTSAATNQMEAHNQCINGILQNMR